MDSSQGSAAIGVWYLPAWPCLYWPQDLLCMCGDFDSMPCMGEALLDTAMSTLQGNWVTMARCIAVASRLWLALEQAQPAHATGR